MPATSMTQRALPHGVETAGELGDHREGIMGENRTGDGEGKTMSGRRRPRRVVRQAGPLFKRVRVHEMVASPLSGIKVYGVATICPMCHKRVVDARPLIGTKRVYADGLIVQAVVWWLPAPTPPSRHRYKYRLFCGRPGERLVGFDNERGKGDHRHVLGVESAYQFTTLESLLADFAAAVEQVTGMKP